MALFTFAHIQMTMILISVWRKKRCFKTYSITLRWVLYIHMVDVVLKVISFGKLRIFLAYPKMECSFYTFINYWSFCFYCYRKVFWVGQSYFILEDMFIILHHYVSRSFFGLFSLKKFSSWQLMVLHQGPKWISRGAEGKSSPKGYPIFKDKEKRISGLIE